MGIWVHALLNVNSINLTIIYVWIKCILSSKMQIILLRFKSEKQQWVLEWTDTQTYTWLKVRFMQTAKTLNLNLQTGPFQISQSHITHSGDDSGLGNCNLKELLTYLSKVAAFRVIKTL